MPISYNFLVLSTRLNCGLSGRTDSQVQFLTHQQRQNSRLSGENWSNCGEASKNDRPYYGQSCPYIFPCCMHTHTVDGDPSLPSFCSAESVYLFASYLESVCLRHQQFYSQISNPNHVSGRFSCFSPLPKISVLKKPGISTAD